MLDKPLHLESLGVGFQWMHKPCGSLLAESQWLLIFSCVWHLLQTPAVSDTVELNRQSRSQAKLTKLQECFSHSFPRATETAESRWWPATVAVWSFSSLSRSEVGARQFLALTVVCLHERRHAGCSTLHPAGSVWCSHPWCRTTCEELKHWPHPFIWDSGQSFQKVWAVKLAGSLKMRPEPHFKYRDT